MPLSLPFSPSSLSLVPSASPAFPLLAFSGFFGSSILPHSAVSGTAVCPAIILAKAVASSRSDFCLSCLKNAGISLIASSVV